MVNFEGEWDFYLQAFRLHQGLSKGGSAEAQRLLRQAFTAALDAKRVVPRAYGLISFTILNAWLSDWIDRKMAAQIRADAIADLGNVISARDLPQEPLDDLRKAEGDVDTVIRAVILAYARIAALLGEDDYDNLWSLATANLYARNFQEALDGYAAARDASERLEVPEVCKGSLAVDFADVLFFCGDSAEDSSNAAFCRSIKQAIKAVQSAIKNNPKDPKRHRWNWTLGWAYYELGNFEDPKKNRALSLETLQKIRTPHDLIKKNLIATLASLGKLKEARKIAAEFMENNPKYTLKVENRWPYRNEVQLKNWKDHLAKGGLEKPAGKPASSRKRKH